jgi:hypothetical protein
LSNIERDDNNPTLRASAMCFRPAAPMLLLRRFTSVRVVLTWEWKTRKWRVLWGNNRVNIAKGWHKRMKKKWWITITTYRQKRGDNHGIGGLEAPHQVQLRCFAIAKLCNRNPSIDFDLLQTLVVLLNTAKTKSVG